jgi:hypothetical protein
VTTEAIQANDVALPGDVPARDATLLIDRRKLAAWDATGAIAILLVGSFLHFAYELSGFSLPVAIFGSVNESTWEHLKLFLWPGLGFAIVQHAYLRDEVHNFWLAKAAAMTVTALAIVLSFYCYLGIALPLYGRGFLAADIGTAVFGIVLGQWVSWRLLTGQPKAAWTRIAGIVAILLMIAAVIAFTFVPPRVFLFENFYGYRYLGEFGILSDYTPYLVFR